MKVTECSSVHVLRTAEPIGRKSLKSDMWCHKNEGDERRSGKENPLKRDG